ncbi:hypothetical protein SpCBS45565_g07800 [Spizellomyces sp. 'palustris']|nr:hypothetical protein SpCBS45565_g07800 [Spizellomyces sp. 'palustris']
MGNTCRKAEVQPEKGYRKVTLDDFVVQRAIGKGAFGKVSIIQKKKGGQQFALKYINKSKCIAEKAVHHIIQERNLLEEVKHPFICNLRYSFQDGENLYMALDLMTGGDLRFHLGKPMKEAACKVILAEVASALDFLHGHRIVHRDVKPDNILLDENGHAYLTDFNIAVKFREEKPLKSVAGTEPYMAPELLLGAGYFATVDWWSLGVMAYELMLGERPFRGKHKRDLIKKGDWKFPNPSSSSSDILANPSKSQKQHHHQPRYPRITDVSKSFISGLMTVDIHKRLGCGEEGREALREHAFFSDIAWDKLLRREFAPVFVPPKNKANFDATHDLEEILLNDNPLGSKSRHKKMDPGALSPEMMMIERQFLYYDYTHPEFIDSQDTGGSPIASMDLAKLRESCISMDAGLQGSRSMSVINSSRSQQFPHSASLSQADSASGQGNASAPFMFRRAASAITDDTNRFGLQGSGPKEVLRSRALSQGRRDDVAPVSGTSPGIIRGNSAGVLMSAVNPPPVPAIPPIANPGSQKMLLEETNQALKLGIDKTAPVEISA